MLRAGYSVETLAEAAGVVSKSVQRWVAGEVTPFSRTRFRVAALLKEDEGYLWPQAVNHAALVGAELVATYPRRTDVPGHLWTDLLRAARRKDGKGRTLTDALPEGLRRRIVADYDADPVPRDLP